MVGSTRPRRVRSAANATTSARYPIDDPASSTSASGSVPGASSTTGTVHARARFAARRGVATPNSGDAAGIAPTDGSQTVATPMSPSTGGGIANGCSGVASDRSGVPVIAAVPRVAAFVVTAGFVAADAVATDQAARDSAHSANRPPGVTKPCTTFIARP